MDDYKIESIEKGSRLLISFLDDVLPFKYDQQVFDWEYYHNKKIFKVLTLDGEIVGAQGMIPVQLNFSGLSILSAKSETSYLHSSAQGKGLFKKLYKSVIDSTFDNEIKIIWGFTSLGKVWNKLGFQTKTGIIKVASLPIKADRVLYNQFDDASKFIKKLKYLKAAFGATRTMLKMKFFLNRDQKILENFVLLENLRDRNDIVDLHQRISNSYVRIEMNQEYLNYRLNQNPFLDYSTFYLYDENHILRGYSILSIKNGVASLVDVFGETKEIKKVLINFNIRKLQKMTDVYRVNLFGNLENKLMSESFEIFKEYGAIRYDSGLHFVLLRSEVRNIKDWYINGLWTEGINQ